MMALEDRVERLEEESQQTRELVITCAQAAQNAQVTHEQNRVMLNALADVQGNHTERLNTIDGRLDRIEGRLDNVEHTLAEHDRRFDAVDRRFDEVDRRFDEVDLKFEAVDQRFDGIEKQLSDMRGTIGKVAVGMYTLERLIRRIGPADDAATS